MKLNPEVKQMWLDALRSGKYKQGRIFLQNGRGEFCCLGVLEECHASVDPSAKPILKEGQCAVYSEGSMSSLSKFTSKWAFNEGGCADPAVQYEGTIYGLWHLNDTKKLNFDQIADLIEEHL